MSGLEESVAKGSGESGFLSRRAKPKQPSSMSPLRRNVLFNVLGLGAPLLVAVFTIPLLIEGLGTARFGLLTLVWAVVGYFGLFDLGLGRALTRQLALEIGSGRLERVGPTLGTSGVIMLALGVCGAALMAAASPWVPTLIVDVPDADELTRAVFAMALVLPAIVLTSGLRGVLEAEHAFGLVNLIRVPIGLFTFVGPLIVLWTVGPKLDWIAAILAAGRLLACVAHLAAILHVYEGRLPRLRFDRNFVRPLLSTGGWMTASNVISPLMGYADRFVIGALVSAAAVAWYATPHELVSKLWIVPGALTAVLFPTFAAQFARNPGGNTVLFRRSVAVLFAVLLPVTASLALFANEGLSLWIDPEFASRSALLLQVFALGTLVNCLAHIPFTLLQSSGGARLTAMAHVVELPLFLVLLWYLTVEYGAIGTAGAWLLRIVGDTVLMFELCRRQQGWRMSSMLGRGQLLPAALTLVAFSSVWIPSVWARAAVGLIVLLASLLLLIQFMGWHRRT